MSAFDSLLPEENIAEDLVGWLKLSKEFFETVSKEDEDGKVVLIVRRISDGSTCKVTFEEVKEE